MWLERVCRSRRLPSVSSGFSAAVPAASVGEFAPRLVVAFLAVLAGWCLAGPAQAQVKLSLEDFQKLRQRAQPPELVLPPPPAPFAFELAELDLVVGEVSARLDQTLTLTLFADGWQRIPLGRSGSFTGADWRGLEGRVETQDQGAFLVVRGRGQHTLSLQSVVELRKDESSTRPAWSFELSPPPAAVIRGNLRTSAAVEEVQLSASQDGPTAALRAIGPRHWSFVDYFTPERRWTFGLYGRRILPEKAQLPLRYEARVLTQVVVSRTQLSVEGQVSVLVAQGRQTELLLALPSELETVGVDGPVAGWEVLGTGAERRLKVVPLEPVEKSLDIKIRLRGRNAESFVSPLLIPDGSRRTTYLSKATLQGDGLLDLVDAASARASTLAERELVGQAAERRLLAIADPLLPPRWQVVWAEGTDVLAAQVDRLLVDAALGPSGQAAYQVWAVIRNRGALTFELSLPPGFQLIDAARDGQMVAPGETARGAYSVPLASGDEPQVIHLRGVLPLALPIKSGELQVPMPQLSAPAAKVEARLVLPGAHSFGLADPSRAAAIALPPDSQARGARRLEATRANVIAQQVVAFLDAPTSGSGFFVAPSGYQTMTAAWSALSATPAPLAIKVTLGSEVASWF